MHAASFFPRGSTSCLAVPWFSSWSAVSLFPVSLPTAVPPPVSRVILDRWYTSPGRGTAGSQGHRLRSPQRRVGAHPSQPLQHAVSERFHICPSAEWKIVNLSVILNLISILIMKECDPICPRSRLFVFPFLWIVLSSHILRLLSIEWLVFAYWFERALKMWGKLAFCIWSELRGFIFSLFLFMVFVWKTFSHEEHLLYFFNSFICYAYSLSFHLSVRFLQNAFLLRCELETQLRRVPQVALHLFPVHVVEGHSSSLLIWNASIIYLIPICIWVFVNVPGCSIHEPALHYFNYGSFMVSSHLPPQLLFFVQKYVFPRIMLHFYINSELVSGDPSDSAHSCGRLTYRSIYLSLLPWG